MNDEDALVFQILSTAHTSAVVGISADRTKSAYDVPAYLQTHDYTIIPVNPKLEAVLGETAYPDLASVPVPVDVVQIFRRGEFVPEIVEEAIAIGAKTVWMQPGVVNDAAAERAREAGLQVVTNQCMRVQHLRFFGS